MSVSALAEPPSCLGQPGRHAVIGPGPLRAGRQRRPPRAWRRSPRGELRSLERPGLLACHLVTAGRVVGRLGETGPEGCETLRSDGSVEMARATRRCGSGERAGGVGSHRGRGRGSSRRWSRGKVQDEAPAWPGPAPGRPLRNRAAVGQPLERPWRRRGAGGRSSNALPLAGAGASRQRHVGPAGPRTPWDVRLGSA